MRKIAALAVALTLVADSALADAIRVDFAGFVDSIFSDGIPDPNSLLPDSVHVGTRFSGYFTIDVDAAPVSVGPATGAIYAFERPDWTMHTELGDLVFETIDRHSVQVFPGDPTHESFVAVFGNRVTVGLIGASANDPISSTELSLVPWILSAYAAGGASWLFESPPFTLLSVHGTVDTLSSSAVPEPEEGLLAGLAAAVVILGSVLNRAARRAP